ncbi:MAG: lipoyl(octanoyl) transferase LipB [Saprospiraceae bacterium]
MQTVRFQDLGLMRYQAAWDFQTALHRRLVENKLANRHLLPKTYPQEHHLLFVEHPPVYTLGRSGSMGNLLLSEAELAERGIEFFPINRGGDITFHGPGQIVGYPILDLECFFTDVHRYVRNIEEVIIRTIAEYGIEGIRIKDYTGVWVQSMVNGQRSTLKSAPSAFTSRAGLPSTAGLST